MRKSFKKLTGMSLSLMLALPLLQIPALAQDQEAVLKDIQDHWGKSGILKWASNGIISGYEDGTFKPDAMITRAELVKMINAVFGFEKASTQKYADVRDGAWYASEIAKARAAGYFQGTDGNLAKPEAPLSRQDAAALLARVFSLQAQGGSSRSFADDKEISEYAKNAITALVERGVLSGYEDGAFHPLQTLTRAEAAKLLDGLVQGFYGKSGTYTDQQINGTALINTGNVNLKDSKIDGDLILTVGVGEGDVTLTNVTVTKTVLINGGGKHSIHFVNSTVGNVVVNKAGGEVRVVAEGSTNIRAMNVQTPAIVEVQEGAKLSELNLNAGAEVTGNERIGKMSVNADGVTVDGKQVPKNSKPGSEPTPAPTPSSGGGGNSGSSDDSGSGQIDTSQVPQPTANKAQGAWKSGISVTLSDSTSGTSIYYTLDGSSPTVNSILYAGPISITADTTIKAIAVKSGMTNSSISTFTYKIDPNLAVLSDQASIQSVIGEMTLAEKAALVVGGGMTVDKVSGAAGMSIPIERLGIPSMTLSDGPAGVRINPTRTGDTQTYYATAFPVGTLIASTWDTELAKRVGNSMGNELKEYGIDVFLAPGMNIHRDPLNGRNFEYFSEDPIVAGKMAGAEVSGVQQNGVGTTIKHFAANNQETNRMGVNSIISERALREIYLKGFETAVKDSEPWAVMSSYNKINGTYTSQSKDLLTNILRNDWGYKGFVMSDWFAGDNPVEQVKAGNDLIEPGGTFGSFYPDRVPMLIAAVNNGTLDESVLDRNITNILQAVLKSPTFNKYAYSNHPNLEANLAVSRQAAEEGMVLLKNNGAALPINKAQQKVALFGNAQVETIKGGTGSGDVNVSHTTTIVEGLQNQGFSLNQDSVASTATYVSEQRAGDYKPVPGGFFGALENPYLPEKTMTSAELDAAVASSDKAVITIARNSGEGADRKAAEGDFYLSPSEKEMIAKVSAKFHAAGKKVVVVLNIGGPVEVASWRDQVDSILLAWQPGQDAGTAIADVLSGVTNPSGKLATTFPVKYSDSPSSDNFGSNDNVTYAEDIYVGYRYYDSFGVKPAYEFGYGLSYTKFDYSNLHLSSANFNGSLTATVDVTNSGNVAGKEVVQVYLSAPGADKPYQELKTFGKTKLLQPGEKQTLTFTIQAKDLASFNETKSAWIADAGTYKLRIGASSRDARLSGKFTLAQELQVETVSKSLAPQGIITKKKPTKLTDEASIDKVISEMTLEEKASMVAGDGMTVPKVPGAAGMTIPIDRLGIPSMTLSDGPAGVRINPTRTGDTNTYYATAYPVGTLIASSWDTELAKRVGNSMGNELKEYGIDVFLAPGMNIHRDPLNGRNFEYFSEDPLVSGKMAGAEVNGVESNGVGATIKHFAANNQETNRMTVNSVISQRALREIYLKGFEIAVKDSQPWAVMSSYNKINGTYTSQSKDLLTNILRNDWGYQGFVMTDWFAGDNPVAQMKAGNDLIEPGGSEFAQYFPDPVPRLIAAVKNGMLEESILDTNIKNILKAVLKSPTFQHYAYSNHPNLADNAVISRQAAEEGMVLLKNKEVTLPLQKDKTIGLFGNAQIETIKGGTGSGDVNVLHTVNVVEGMSSVGVSVYGQLETKYGDYVATQRAGDYKPVPGTLFGTVNPYLPEMPIASDYLDSVVSSTYKAVIVIGRNSGEGADRTATASDYYLSQSEQDLIKTVSDKYHAAGKQVVVVLNIGGPVEVASWRDQVDAILLAWQPGMEAGTAIADVLTGVTNPSGKLATTFPMDYTDVPSKDTFGDPTSSKYNEDIYVGYRYYDTFNKVPAYEFGYGLSYSQFGYRNLTINRDAATGQISVTANVYNAGSTAGKEVVQVYISAPGSNKPVQELKAFAKTGLLGTGESQTLTFTIDPKDLASFDEAASSWVTDAGEYQVRVGASSRNTQLTGTFSIPESISQPVSNSLAPIESIDRLTR